MIRGKKNEFVRYSDIIVIDSINDSAWIKHILWKKRKVKEGIVMKAKEYLQQVVKLDKLIQNKIIEKEQWKSVATSTTSHADGERVQSSGSKQKMADAVCRYVEMEDEIDAYIDRLIDTKNEVIKTIEQLNATEYDLLHKVYIQMIPLDSVAYMYEKTYSWATTVHGRALKHVQDLLDEKE